MMHPSERTTAAAQVNDLHRNLKHLERRDWWLWITAAVILILLCVTLFSFSFPFLWSSSELLSHDQLAIRMRGLFGLVLLFTVFAFYQQYLIKQLRSKLQAQIAVVAELHAKAETVERLSIMDPLTGLFNRRFAIEYLPREIARCDRDKLSMIVAMIDLDRFKTINANHGREVGDAVLEGFANHVRKGIRSADLPVRLDEDEFLIILPGCGVDDVYRPLERLRGCQVKIGEITIPVEFTVAWVQRREGELAGEVLHRADEALYSQKHARAASAEG